MVDERPQAVRIPVAQLWGEARRRARWRELSSDEEAVTPGAVLAGRRSVRLVVGLRGGRG